MSLLAIASALLLRAPLTTGLQDPIGPPPLRLSYKGFYKKCAYFRGLPIIGSEKVRDQAFHVLIHTFTKMPARVPDSTFHLNPMLGLQFGEDLVSGLRPTFLDVLFSFADRGKEAFALHPRFHLLVGGRVDQHGLHLAIDGEKHRLFGLVQVVDESASVALKLG